MYAFLNAYACLCVCPLICLWSHQTTMDYISMTFCMCDVVTMPCVSVCVFVQLEACEDLAHTHEGHHRCVASKHKAVLWCTICPHAHGDKAQQPPQEHKETRMRTHRTTHARALLVCVRRSVPLGATHTDTRAHPPRHSYNHRDATVMDRCGLLTPLTVLAHGVHLSPEEMRLLRCA